MAAIYAAPVKTEDGYARRIGAALETARMWRQLSQEQLASAAGISVSTVSRYENGETRAFGDTMVALAHALDVPLALLLEPPERDELLLAIAAHDGLRRAAREPS